MTEAGIQKSKTLDVRDTFCPVPVLRAQEEIKNIEVDEVLEILATDEGSKGDIPAWAKNTGQELIEMSESNGTFRFLIKRKK